MSKVHNLRVTRFCSKSFFKILNKRAIKHKIWWYHWNPRWILSMRKFKNLFLTEKIKKDMTIYQRDININQLGVRSLFGCLFVYVTQENAYNLLSFSARKIYFFLHKIQWGFQSVLLTFHFCQPQPQPHISQTNFQ